MSQLEVGFIGVGNMATAILNGVLRSQLYRPEQIGLYDINEEKMQGFVEQGCTAFSSISSLATACSLVVLAIKPQQFPEVLPQIKEGIQPDTVLVSIAAGVTSGVIKQAMGFDCAVVRGMPNTPLLLGKGATVLARVEPTSTEDFERVKALFATAGIVEEIPENLINSSMPVHGSSPAFIYQFAKLLIDNAVAVGFEREMASRLVIQTLIGSGEMLRSAGKTPEELITMVCSPGGTTLAGMAALEESGFDQAIENAFSATIWRGIELAGGVPEPQAFTVEVVAYGSDAYQQAKALREALLREPLGLKLGEKELEQDKIATHICAIHEGRVIGTAQLLPKDAFIGGVGQVAVDSAAQRNGVGASLMQKVEQEALALGLTRLALNARMTAKNFYLRMGYLSRGAVFTELGIPHVAMYKEIVK